MIPAEIVQRGLSLGSEQGPTNVLTFSFKADKSGDIVDYNVRAGIVRNVQTLRYDDVDMMLGAST